MLRYLRVFLSMEFRLPLRWTDVIPVLYVRSCWVPDPQLGVVRDSQ
ncbi:hypothetical protein LINPERPRIM_LOCUS27799 [Linum perenne]